MKGTTHREIALASSVAVGIAHMALTQSLITPVLGLTLVPLLWIPLAPVGGYLPDVDKKGTTANRWFRKYHAIFYVLVVLSLLVLPWYMSLIFLASFSLFELLVLKSVHRRETHSFVFLVVVSSVSIFFGSLFAPLHEYLAILIYNLLLGTVLGALSHDVADMFNKRPVQFAFPIEILLASKDRPRAVLPRLGNIITGSPEEDDFKNKWIIICVLITIGLSIPSLLGFVGITIPFIIEGSFLLMFIVLIVLLWEFLTNTIRMSLVIGILLVILYVIIVTYFPELNKFNFIRGLFV